MARSRRSGTLDTMLSGAGQAMLFILCGMCVHLPVEAAKPVQEAGNPEQTSFIVYLHPVASDTEIRIDGLPVWQTGSVFGVWCYQFNLTSFLDTSPRRVEIRMHPGNNDTACCDVEVRKISGHPATATLLAQKTIRAADSEDWNKALTVVSLDLALPERSPRPLWVEAPGIDLHAAGRDTYTTLVKEIYTAIRLSDVDALMRLIDPALADQALMEGVPPDLLKQAMRGRLLRHCIPDIPVAGTMQAFTSGPIRIAWHPWI